MRIACIYWWTPSVGGIATHLNSLRTAAIRYGDTFDILHSKAWKTKVPCVFPERKWIRGGDTKIWIDGEIPSGENNAESSARWLEENYDAVCFGFICPHKRKDYPEPVFLPIYDCRLPKAAYITDGYWHEYSDWAEPLLEKLNGLLCVQDSYAEPIRQLGYDVQVSPAPFQPAIGKAEKRDKEPLLIWPNQWKNIKGINQFLDIVPSLPESVNVELYSNGIRYYQLRTEDRWRDAIGEDKFQGYNGNGRATFFGNVDLPEITKAYQRAWFTVNLQGMSTRKDTYKNGSYNLTEVEALFYGACPILHSSTLKTGMPEDIFIPVDSAEEIPSAVERAIGSGYAICPERQRKARQFVVANHLASNRYLDLRSKLV